MGKYIRPFRCEIVTPEGAEIAFEAYSVQFPAADGSIGVLGGRAPLAAVVGAGALVAEETGGKKREYFIAGGFARMRDDHLTILAEQCAAVSDLDPEAVWQEIEKARALPEDTPAQETRKEELLHHARTKFMLIQRRRQASQQERLEEMTPE